MKTLPAAVALILAAGAGFSLGWYPDGRGHGLTAESPRAAARRESPPPPAPAPASKLPGFALELPDLPSADACRLFLKELDTRYRGRHPLLRDTARDFALRRWLELDAESALAEAERGSGSKGIGNDLFRVWLDLNPESAIAAWNQTSPALAAATRDSFLSTLAETDVARAFALLSTPRGKSGWAFSDPAAEAILRLWAQRDPLAALAAAKPPDEDSPEGRARVQFPRDVIFEAWASSDPAALFAYAKISPNSESSLENLAGWLVPALLKSDPKAAAEVIAACADSTYSLASKWADNDPRSALGWAETQPVDSRQAQAVKLHAARKLATADPLRDIALLGDCRSAASGDQGYWLNEGYREAFASLSATDPDKAREMIAGNPDLATSGVNGYLTHAFAKDAAEAIAQARKWLEVPALAATVVPAIRMAYSMSNGAPARDFSPVLAAMPELASRVDAETLRGWAMAAPESAAEFLASREAAGKPVAGVKDAAVLTSIANARPEWTSQWLSGLPEGLLRQDTAEMLSANWSAYDPGAAKDWIDSLPPGPSREAAVKAWDKRLEVPNNPFLLED
ncbi:MAG: hypothetical protein V4726_02720 [Verrucomicrobiota bacterium]